MAAFQTDSAAIYEISSPVVSFINSILTRIVPGMELYLVIAISLFIAYLLKHKNNWNNALFAAAGIFLFGGLRYLGIGG